MVEEWKETTEQIPDALDKKKKNLNNEQIIIDFIIAVPLLVLAKGN